MTRPAARALDVVLARPRALAFGAALLAPAALAGAAAAQVFMTQAQALAQAFPGARIERRALALTEEQRGALEQRARVRVTSRLATAYLAWHGDTLSGTAFFDSRVVRTMPAVLMVTVAPDTTVRRVDILAFHEPPDYRPTPRWLDQFPGHHLDDGLWPQRDIRTLAGATLTTRAVTESVRLALALYQLQVAPTVSRAPRAVTGGGSAR